MNKKIGILFDSSCGYTKSKIEEDGNLFVPMSVEIDGKEYLSGIDLDNELLFKKFEEVKKPFKTSAVNMQVFEDTLREGLEIFENIIVISISKHISGTNQNMKHFVEKDKEFSERVIVFDSEFLTPWIQIMYNDLLNLINYENVEINNVLEFLEFYNKQQVGYLAPDTLERLRIGGRLTALQYNAAKILKIFPILEIIRGDVAGAKIYKVRHRDKIVPKLLEQTAKIYKSIEEKDPNATIKILYLHHDNHEMKAQMEKICKENGYYIDGEVILSPEINAHVGEKAFGFGCIHYKTWKHFI